jgi:phospholipid/cholesterol/gamma-HCH transport system permease protein
MTLNATASPARIRTLRTEGGSVTVRFEGDWVLSNETPSVSELGTAMDGVPGLMLDTSDVGAWDSALVNFVLHLRAAARDRGVPVDLSRVVPGVVRLCDLAEAVPEKADARRGEGDISILARIGFVTASASASIKRTMGFVGELTLSAASAVRGRAVFRTQDLLLMLQRAGVEALPIAALVSFLLGLILAFIGAIQLAQFGATIYVANLVGIAMVRDMGALMTAIVMAGRSGAAYAAELGSMQASQEIDALETTGVSPMDFLVLPRVLAITLMMPVLTIFADLVGILGGATVALSMLDIGPIAYYEQTVEALTLGHLMGGLIKGLTYGLLVGMAGCLRGLQSGKSSLAVGAAATSAVVTGIIWIISACGIFQFLQYVLGIG